MTNTTTAPATDADADAAAGQGPTRRQVLLTSGVVAAAAAVTAACGSSSSGSGTTSTPTSGGAGSSTPAASESASSAGTGGVTVKTADVPVGGGTILQDQKIVVTQPAAGEYKAFTAVCTHQGCLVSSVKDDTITCPCHGSTFSAKDGSVTGGPAQGPLAEAAISVSGDTITIG